MKLHLLAILAHPDDAELGCGGTLIKHANKGQQVGILDLTRGEMGTRGTPEGRLEEAANAAKIMGLAVRKNAGFRDGFFKHDEEHILELVRYLRRWQPEIVLTNAPTDRHPDHGRGQRLAVDACFLAGLKKIETKDGGKIQEAWRPKRVFQIIQDQLLEPTFIVDIEEVAEQKKEAIKAYESQFHNPASKEPMTYIAANNFLELIAQRDAIMGKRIGTAAGEGFLSVNIPGLTDLDSLLLPAMA